MKMTRFWLLVLELQRWDFWKHFICVHSYPSKATLAVLSFHSSSLDCGLLWKQPKTRWSQERQETLDKRGQMRGKFVRRRRCQHCSGWESQTSDMVYHSNSLLRCSKCFFSFGSTQHTTMKSSHAFWLQFSSWLSVKKHFKKAFNVCFYIWIIHICRC